MAERVGVAAFATIRRRAAHRAGKPDPRLAPKQIRLAFGDFPTAIAMAQNHLSRKRGGQPELDERL